MLCISFVYLLYVPSMQKLKNVYPCDAAAGAKLG